MNVFNILTLIFITLKVCNIIDWSWWWVFTPLYVLFLILFLAGFFGALMVKVDPLWRVKEEIKRRRGF